MTVRESEPACSGCGCCVSVCPEDAWVLSENRLDHHASRCIHCDQCLLACPLGVPFLREAVRPRGGAEEIISTPVEGSVTRESLRSAGGTPVESAVSASKEVRAGGSPKTAYDVVVIGAGPAGSTAAWRASLSGASTLLLERDERIGIPIRCAEMVSLDQLAPYLSVPEEIIFHHLEHDEIVTPDKTSSLMKLNGRSVILSRTLFDAYLAELAADSGAEVITRADATGLKKNPAGWEVALTHRGVTRSVEAKFVIGADGIESRVGRWAGIDTTLAAKDLQCGVQYDLANLELADPTRCLFFFDNGIAPGGYAWLFPKGPSRANVGLAVRADRAKGTTAKEYLDRFVADRFPDAEGVAVVTGGIPVAEPVRGLAKDGLLLVGDAARLVNSMDGAGIFAAVRSGFLAGEVAGHVVRGDRGDRDDRRLFPRKTWPDRKERIRLQFFYAASKVLQGMTDEQLCRVNALARGVSKEKLALPEYGKIILQTEPRLFAEVTRSFFRRRRRRGRISPRR